MRYISMGSEFSANLVLKLVKVKVDIKRKIFRCKVPPVNIVCSYFVPLLQVTNSTHLLKQSNDEHNVRKLFRYMHVRGGGGGGGGCNFYNACCITLICHCKFISG